MTGSLPLLTTITVVPLLAGLALLSLGRRGERVAGRVAGLSAALTLVLAGCVWAGFDVSAPGMQWVERHAWIAPLHVDYHLGVDGLGVLMVALAALVVPAAMLVPRPGMAGQGHLYFGLTLLLQSGLFGTFTALNFFHWFLFWELSLIPAFFLIRFWGGPNRGVAATQFFVYTMVGSVALLLAFLTLYRATGTFDFLRLAEWGRVDAQGTSPLRRALATTLGWGRLTGDELAMGVFAGVLLGFAVKVPLMPFHAWLPGAYSEAATGTTMILTGVMSKMGLYGLMRICQPLFPQELQRAMGPLVALAVLTILASAAAAMVQRDLKRILAYSSINHLGYCLLGMFAAGGTLARGEAQLAVTIWHGVIFQAFSHGLCAAALFGWVACLEQRSNGARGLDDFGGLRQAMPVLAGLAGLTVFASIGLPGLSGFIGELLIFKGVFATLPWAAGVALPGLLLTAVFLLRLWQRVFYGPLRAEYRSVADVSGTERMALVPLATMIVILGVCPAIVLRLASGTAAALATSVGP
jgi:NADH-quinone oxidoreductase subunit M